MENTNMVPSGTFLGPIQLFDKAWMIFEKKWKTMILIMLPMIGFALIWAIFVVVLIGGSAFGMMAGKSNPAATAGIGVFAVILGVLSYIAFIVALLWVQLAQMYLIVNHTREVTFKEAYGSTKKYILSLIWVAILSAAITVPGFFLFIIPGIILAVWFTFSQFVLVDQGVRGLNALLTSREYVRGRWWGVFGRSLAFMVVYFIIMILFSAVEGVMRNSGYTLASAIVSMISSLVNIVLSFLVTIYMFVMYENLREIKGTSIAIAGSTRKKFSIIGVVGILCVIGLFLSFLFLIALNPAGVLKISRNAVRVSDVVTVQKSLKVYYADQGVYPSSLQELVTKGLIPTVPVDPSSQKPLLYQTSPDYSDFRLCTMIEPVDSKQMKVPVDANGYYCVTARDAGANTMMQYAPETATDSGDLMMRSYGASDSGAMMDAAKRMMRPQGYSADPSAQEDGPNRY